MQRKHLLIAAAAALGASMSASAIEINSGSAEAEIFDGFGAGTFSPGDGLGDVLYESDWGIRVGGGTATSVFSAFTSSGGDGTDTATYSGTISGLDFVVTYTIVDGGSAMARLDQTLTVTNSSGSAIMADIFSYTDFDLAGAGGDDGVFSGDTFTVTDDDSSFSGNYASYAASGADSWSHANYDSLVDGIFGTSGYDLPSAGAAYSGDWTGAFQWDDRMILDGESKSFSASIAVNMEALVVPLPAPALLALVGLGGVAAVRRRRLVQG